MRRPLRVAAVQAESVSGDVEANVRTAARIVARADADLVVFPELFLTGYDPAHFTPTNTITAEDPRLDPLRRPGPVVLLGAAVGRHIAVVMVDREGAVSTPYAKQHIDPDEVAYFDAGSHGAVVDVDGWRVGLGVCWDSSFPDHIAAARAAGAELYACPSAWYAGPGAEARRDEVYAARAREAGIPVVLSALTGGPFCGGAAVFGPDRVLAQGDSEVVRVELS